LNSGTEFTVLNLGDLDKLLRAIADTRETEIGCDECFEQMDHFAEMELSGMDAGSVMPLVSDHLSNCEDCREKFEALLGAMRAT
jgi:hypothetical protein